VNFMKKKRMILFLMFLAFLLVFSIGCSKKEITGVSYQNLDTPDSEEKSQENNAEEVIADDEQERTEQEKAIVESRAIVAETEAVASEQNSGEQTTEKTIENAERQSQETTTARQRTAIPEQKLIQPAELVYQGAFRLPEASGTEGAGWEWGGTALAYYPDGDSAGANDKYPGSLFATAHEWYQNIGELSIPAPVNSRNLGDLNTAEMLQGLTDIKGDMFGYLEIPRVGLAYLPKQGSQNSGKLYFAWGQHMQELDAGASHGWFNTDLSNPETAGPWRIKGEIKYTTTDYMFDIPKDFADKYLNGMMLATGRYRDGGQGTQGPSLIAIAPWKNGNPPAPESEIDSLPLLKYSSVYDDFGGVNAVKNYCHSDIWSGGAWLTKDDKAAVVFVGKKGKGACWYGYPDGIRVDTSGNADAEYVEGEGQRGWWADRFVAEIMFYDPADFARVANGDIEPYEPQPYVVLEIQELMHNTPLHEIRDLGAVAFDRENGILYLFEFLGDAETERPLVHVWKLR
jgi:hypothetical protein